MPKALTYSCARSPNAQTHGTNSPWPDTARTWITCSNSPWNSASTTASTGSVASPPPKYHPLCGVMTSSYCPASQKVAQTSSPKPWPAASRPSPPPSAASPNSSNTKKPGCSSSPETMKTSPAQSVLYAKTPNYAKKLPRNRAGTLRPKTSPGTEPRENSKPSSNKPTQKLPEIQNTDTTQVTRQTTGDRPTLLHSAEFGLNWIFMCFHSHLWHEKFSALSLHRFHCHR